MDFIQPRRLLLDLDGTLLHVRKLPYRAEFATRFVLFARSRGISMRCALRGIREVYSALSTPGVSGELEDRNDWRASRAWATACGLSPEEAYLFLGQAMDEVYPRLQKHTGQVQGAAEFVEWAHSWFPLTLATNPVWPERIARLKLSWTGIPSSRFGELTSAESMHACKPSLDYYRELLGQLGARPEDCLLVGDSLRKDGVAANLGMSVFLIRPQAPLRQLRERLWQGSFAELQKAISRRRS